MKKNIVKVTLLFVITIFSFMYTIKALDSINLDIDDLFLEALLGESSNIESDSFTSNVVDYVLGLNLFNPVSMFTSSNRVLNVKPMPNNSNNNNNPPLEVPVVSLNNKPIVYIYNTHQKEEYTSSSNNKLTVLNASYMLQEKLKKYNINSIVENSDVTELLRINNWNYASSYLITKMLLEQAKSDYSSLVYYVDLHRDSVSKSKTTVKIGDKSYAKVMFLLGLDNAEYKESEIVISRFNNIISTRYPGISRGIYEKGGKGVNGIYNQDFSKNCILIEVGGVDNTIDEVSNTIDAIADMMNIYIGEYHE